MMGRRTVSGHKLSPLHPTKRQVIAELDAISGDDPEEAHSQADAALLAYVNPEVREAYDRVVARYPWWAGA